MPSIIRIKRSSTTGAPSTLSTGELAYSALTGTQDNGGDRLYIGFGTETAGNAANHYVIGGKYFTDMLDHVHGTLTASAAIIVDANKKIDELNVDNITINGNSITSTDTNGNILLDPAGSGYVQIVGTNGLVIPVGTALQQGPAVDGAVRLNSTSNQFEGYANGKWSSLGGVSSADGLTYISAEAKTLTITAHNSVGDANLDINVDDAATLDAATISLDATDSSNFSVTTNSASNKTLAIDASNAGLGSAIISVGSTLTDNVNLTTSSTGQITLTSGEVQADVTTLDVNATTVDITTTGASNRITLTGLDAIINADTITLRGTEGAADTAIVNVAGQLNVDNLRLDGNTISTADGSNTLYLDPAPNGVQGLVVIEGDLRINGTATTINSTQVTIDDPIFVLGGDTAPTADDNLDRGIEFQWHDGTNAKLGFFGYDDSTAQFTFIPDATDTAGVISGTAGNVRFGKAALIDATASTTTTSGALTVTGGVGIAGQLNVGGATNKFTATTASSSTATGAVVVAGGVGVGGTIYVGDDIIGAGAATSNLDGFNIDGGTY